MTSPVCPGQFRLLMVSAMYENGGNSTHRFLDGHPELFVYPFESQLGTAMVHDHLTSLFPVKYRWPEFRLSATPGEDYQAIIDEEGKVRARTPDVSKFRSYDFAMDDDERRTRFVELMRGQPRSRPALVAAFFVATFEAWKNVRRSGRESMYVGYSPIVAVDADKILSDLPKAHLLHVVRNPWSAYADTKKRPVPLSLDHYMTAWVTVQHRALVARQAAPERVQVLRYEDLIVDPAAVLAATCRQLGIGPSDSLATPSWNGRALREVYPWGTIRTPSVAANDATRAELSTAEGQEIRRRAGIFLKALDYA